MLFFIKPLVSHIKKLFINKLISTFAESKGKKIRKNKKSPKIRNNRAFFDLTKS